MKKSLLSVIAIMITIIANASAPSGNLHVIYITTQNNAEITSTENYISAAFYIDAMNSGYTSLGSATSQTAMKIRGRGQSSWNNYDKKPYRFKLTVGTKLLDMSKSKNFALIACADDDLAFLRNTVGYRLSQMLGLIYTPDRRAVELVLNGDYKGLYFLVETVRIDKDRVPIVKQNDNETDASLISGGWLLEIDNADDPAQIIITEGNGSKARFTYKDPEILSTAQTDYITSQLNTIDDAIYSNNINSTTWQNHIDIDSLARYYIVQEIMDNTEAFYGSTYLFKNRGADHKWIFGPVWDFGNAYRRNTQQFIYQNTPHTPQIWISEIAKYPAFQAKVKEIWKNFYANQYPSLTSYIDNFTASISAAATCDVQRWPEYGTADMQAKKNEFISLLNARIQWLNERWDETGIDNTTISGGFKVSTSNGMITISASEDINIVTIYDSMGKIISQVEPKSTAYDHQSQNGIYIVEIKTNSQIFQTKVFVK